MYYETNSRPLRLLFFVHLHGQIIDNLLPTVFKIIIINQTIWGNDSVISLFKSHKQKRTTGHELKDLPLDLASSRIGCELNKIFD